MDRKCEFVEHFDDLLVCAICSDTYTSPKKLPCNHTFCLKCLEVYAKHARSDARLVCSCPLCRNETTLRGRIQELPDNRLYACLIDIKNSVRTSLAKYDLVKCSMKSCQSFEEWHCMACDDGFCKTCVSRHDKSHKVIKLETFLQECLASEISDQLRRVEEQLKEREKDFSVAVSVTEAAIAKQCDDLKDLVDQHKEQLLHELKSKKLNHLKELSDLHKELESVIASSVTNNKEFTGTLKKQSLPLKLVDLGGTDVKFIPRNIHQDLLFCGSLSNILGKVALTGQHQLYEADSNNLMEKIESELHTVRTNVGVIVGMAAVGQMVYVVHSLASCVDEYDRTDFSLPNSLVISGLSNPQDMAACERLGCLYVTDSYDDSVYRVETTAAGDDQGKTRKWTMTDQPLGVSVSSQTTNVFVTCLYAQKLYEFSSSGDVVQCIVLHPDISHPHHALQVSSGKIVLSHGFWSTDPLHRVCVVDGHGRSSPCTQYGHEPGSGPGQLNQPLHLATSENGFVFVADSENGRILLLHSSLSTSLVSITTATDSLSDQMKSPHRICLDPRRRLLYAAENTLQNRIFVFNLSKILG